MEHTEHTVLIVEDDHQLGSLYQEIFTLDDLHSELAENGQQALECLDEIVPIAVLLDIHLPDISGLDILTHIRTSERLKDIYVIVVSADALRAREASGSADLTLIKPIDYLQFSGLIQTIKQLIADREST